MNNYTMAAASTMTEVSTIENIATMAAISTGCIHKRVSLENNDDLTQDYPITKRSRHEYATQNVDIPLHLIERQKSAINGDFNIDATVFIQAPSQC